MSYLSSNRKKSFSQISYEFQARIMIFTEISNKIVKNSYFNTFYFCSCASGWVNLDPRKTTAYLFMWKCCLKAAIHSKNIPFESIGNTSSILQTILCLVLCPIGWTISWVSTSHARTSFLIHMWQKFFQCIGILFVSRTVTMLIFPSIIFTFSAYF